MTPRYAPLLVAAFLLLGCPQERGTAPAKQCTKAYEQCVLPSGVLGVCDVATCPTGQPEPCLVCRSQH